MSSRCLLAGTAIPRRRPSPGVARSRRSSGMVRPAAADDARPGAAPTSCRVFRPFAARDGRHSLAPRPIECRPSVAYVARTSPGVCCGVSRRHPRSPDCPIVGRHGGVARRPYGSPIRRSQTGSRRGPGTIRQLGECGAACGPTAAARRTTVSAEAGRRTRGTTTRGNRPQSAWSERQSTRNKRLE